MLGGLVDEIRDLQELGVKETFFKNALNEETQVDSFLAYTRDRVAQFEKERFDWLKRYEMIKVKAEDEHRVEWETRQVREAIALMQKDLSDNRMRLFEERQLILKLQNENTQLRRKNGVDQQVMNTLVNYCNPVEQTVVYSKGNKPSILTKFVNNDLNLDYNRAEGLKTPGTSKRRVDSMLDKHQEAKVFKTLIVNKEIQAKLEGDDGKYLSELQNTAKFLEEMGDRAGPEALDYRTALLNKHLEQARETFEANERQYNLETLDNATKTDALEEKILKAERLVCDLNKEIVKQRIQFEQYEFELHNENEKARRANVELAKKLADLEYGLERERKGISKSIEKMANQQSAKYKAVCRTREAETEKIKQQYRLLQEQHFQKVKALDETLRTQREKYDELAKKKNLELYSFKADNASIRDQFVALLTRLVDSGAISERQKMERLSRFNASLSSVKPSKKAAAKRKASKSRGRQTKTPNTGKSDPRQEEVDPQTTEDEADDDGYQGEAPTREANQQAESAKDKKVLGSLQGSGPTKTLNKRPGSAKPK